MSVSKYHENDKMNVLIIAQLFPPDMGGGATRAYNVAKGLLKANCNVTVIAAFPHYPSGNIPEKYCWKVLAVEFEGRLKIIRTYVPPLASEGFAKRVILFISFMISSLFCLFMIRKVNVVWAANPNIIAMVPGLFYRIVKRCPLIQNVDDLWPEALYDLGLSKKSFLARVSEFMARLTYKLATAITPISPAYVKVLKTKYDVNSDKIHVVQAGVDLTLFSQKAQGEKSVKKKFKVLYIGALSPAYDFYQVFNAAKLLSSNIDVEFIIQGSGELANTLKLKVEKTRLTNVKIIDKVVSRERVAQILSNADVLILPLCGVGSIEQGISSKLYEYQAAGKPILCCSQGEPGRYVSVTKSGIVIPPGDYEALASSVLTLRNNPQLAVKLGDNGRRYVEKNLSIKAIGLQMKDIFDKSLGLQQNCEKAK